MKLKLVKVNTDNKGQNPTGLCTADVTTPPKSEDGRPVLVPGTMTPIDIKSLSLEQQAIAQVLAEEVEKAETAGIDDATINLTPGKVKKMIKKLKRMQKQKLKNNTH